MGLSVCRGPNGNYDGPLPEEEGEEPRFAGRWVTSKGNVHLIGLESIQWSNGELSEFYAYKRWRKPPVCQTKMGGAKFTGELRPDDTLLWSDGDVWVRDTRAPGTKTYEVLGHVGLPFTEYVDPLKRYQDGLNDGPSVSIAPPETAAHVPPADNSGVRLQKLACDFGLLKTVGDNESGTMLADSMQQLPHTAAGRLSPGSSSGLPGTADGPRPKRKAVPRL